MKKDELKSLETIFYINKSKIEDLIHESENLAEYQHINLRTRSTSERTYRSYERIYNNSDNYESTVAEMLKWISDKKASNKAANGILTDKEIIDSCPFKTKKTNKTNQPYIEVYHKNTRGFIDAHIENTFNEGEKYYHLMSVSTITGNFIATKFYDDSAIPTICFAEWESKAFYIPKEAWKLLDFYSWQRFCNTEQSFNTGNYNESIWIAEIPQQDKASYFKSVDIALDGEREEVSNMRLGAPSFRGYNGRCSHYTGKVQNDGLWTWSPLMCREENYGSIRNYTKSYNEAVKLGDKSEKLGERTVSKSISEKGYFYNKYRDEFVFFNSNRNDYLKPLLKAATGNKTEKLESVLRFLVEKKVNLKESTVGIRTAKKEVNLVEEFEKYISTNN